MKKIIITLISLAFVCSPVTSFAVDIAMGVSLERTQNSLYLPIDINNKIQITPFVHYNQYNFNDVSSSGKGKTKGFGFGIFHFLDLTNKMNNTTRFYLGLRLAYKTSSSLRKRRTTVDATEDVFEAKEKWIAPTVGFEFFLNKKVSINANISLERGKSTETVNYRLNNEPNGYRQTTYTFTRNSKLIRLVYHF